MSIQKEFQSTDLVSDQLAVSLKDNKTTLYIARQYMIDVHQFDEQQIANRFKPISIPEKDFTIMMLRTGAGSEVYCLVQVQNIYKIFKLGLNSATLLIDFDVCPRDFNIDKKQRLYIISGNELWATNLQNKDQAGNIIKPRKLEVIHDNSTFYSLDDETVLVAQNKMRFLTDFKRNPIEFDGNITGMCYGPQYVAVIINHIDIQKIEGVYKKPFVTTNVPMDGAVCVNGQIFYSIRIQENQKVSNKLAMFDPVDNQFKVKSKVKYELCRTFPCGKYLLTVGKQGQVQLIRPLENKFVEITDAMVKTDRLVVNFDDIKGAKSVNHQVLFMDLIDGMTKVIDLKTNAITTFYTLDSYVMTQLVGKILVQANNDTLRFDNTQTEEQWEMQIQDCKQCRIAVDNEKNPSEILVAIISDTSLRCIWYNLSKKVVIKDKTIKVSNVQNVGLNMEYALIATKTQQLYCWDYEMQMNLITQFQSCSTIQFIGKMGVIIGDQGVYFVNNVRVMHFMQFNQQIKSINTQNYIMTVGLANGDVIQWDVFQMEEIKRIHVGQNIRDAATNEDRIHVITESGMNIYQ